MLDIVLVMFELRKLCQITNLDADILSIRRNMPQKVKVGEGGGGSDIYLKKIGGGGLRKNYSPWGGQQGDFLDIA